jgi:iron(III) transport system ATP-binding protein
MDAIVIDRISKKYGDVTALHEISLTVADGEFVTLLGPSGCGKTTTLRSIAGLEKPDTGSVVIEGREMFSATNGTFLQPEKRNLGMVFQSYAIWPHMTVFQNVAYALNSKNLSRSDIRAQVEKCLDLVGLGGLGDRPATKLSGGQQQRVALARSLVGEPRVLLLDEPLSNLDAKLRERMRFELKNLQKRLGFTAIYVTHDQAEALALSDRIVVMSGGRIMQQGESRAIYSEPENRFVVDFVGQANFVDGTITSLNRETRIAELRSTSGLRVVGMIPPNLTDSLVEGGLATAALRPEDIHVAGSAPADHNIWEAKVESDLFLGNMRELMIEASGHSLKVQVSSEQAIPANGMIRLSSAPSVIRILAHR